MREPISESEKKVLHLAAHLIEEGTRLGLDPSEIISAAFTVVGLASVSANEHNKNSVVQASRRFADLMESGELGKGGSHTLVFAKTSLH